MKKNQLSFRRGNAKLSKETAVFSLPAGYTCPAANLCKSFAHKLTGKITDGANTLFRCYAASSENLFGSVRKSRWRNLEMLRGKSVVEMAAIISMSIPPKSKRVRIHASGDFFSQDYFDAWLMVAQQNPQKMFYAYTKMLPLWIKRRHDLPSNFRLVASVGGLFDHLIVKHNLRNVSVVFSENEAKKKGLSIDHDDSLAWNSDKNFALLLHGTQPAGSVAVKHLQKLRNAGKGGYKTDYFAGYGKGKKQN